MARKERGNKKLRELMDEYGVKTMEDGTVNSFSQIGFVSLTKWN